MLYDWFGDGSVLVSELGFACCAAEFEAAAAGRATVPAPRPGATVALVVSGTVTRASAGLVRQRAEAVGASAVVAFGACASAGGPYWDSPVVVPVDRLLPVAAYVPGCAPTPAALDAALAGLR